MTRARTAEVADIAGFERLITEAQALADSLHAEFDEGEPITERLLSRVGELHLAWLALINARVNPHLTVSPAISELKAQIDNWDLSIGRRYRQAWQESKLVRARS